MATEAKSFKTGDFMLSKWEEEIEGEGTETQWLPVRLGNHNEENGSWEVFLLIRKMVICHALRIPEQLLKTWCAMWML